MKIRQRKKQIKKLGEDARYSPELLEKRSGKKPKNGKKNQKSSCKLCIFAFHFNDIAGTALSCHKIPPSESGCFNLFIIAFFSDFDKISA